MDCLLNFDTAGGLSPVSPQLVIMQTIKEDHDFNASNAYDEDRNLATARIYDETACNSEESELRILLSQWNQEHLADTLLAQKVYVSTLKMIERHHLKRLLNTFDMGSMGTEILFEHNLEKWRESIGMPLLPYASGDAPISSPIPALSELTRPRTSFRETPSSENSSSNSANTISTSLAVILNGSPRGKMLVEFYAMFSRFQEEQRCSLISLIAHHFEEKSIRMTLSASYKIEKEIIEKFPSEKLEYYRTAKRGRIYNKYANLQQSFKNKVSKHVRNEKEVMKSTRHEKAFEPETDGEICLKALKSDNLSTEEFDRTWKACCQFRLEFIKSKNTIEVFEKWPFYKSPSGYRLIDIDFKTAFDNKDGLLSEWSRNVEKITLFLTTDQHIKDRNARKMLEPLKNNDTLPENFKKLIVNSLNVISAKLSHHDKYFDFITSLLETKQPYNGNNLELPVGEAYESYGHLLPLDDDKGLDNITERLNDVTNFKRLTKELSLIGGNVPEELTKKIMYKIITSEFAQLYSWEGGKGKRKFRELPLARVVFEAVRQNERTKNAFDDEIIRGIKKFLVRAKERVLNKQKKRSCKPQQ